MNKELEFLADILAQFLAKEDDEVVAKIDSLVKSPGVAIARSHNTIWSVRYISVVPHVVCDAVHYGCLREIQGFLRQNQCLSPGSAS